MAVVGHLHRITFGGRLATTESWSCGVHFLTPDAGPLDLSGLMAGAVSQWFLRANSMNSINARLDFLKANELNPASIPSSKPGAPASPPYTRYLSEGETNVFFWPEPQSAGPNNAGDPQSTMAITTLTAVTRGRASKGRFFPPSADLPVDTTGHVIGGQPASMATSAAQLITDLNGSNIGECVVFSVIGQSTQEITGVKVGNVIDTQRRRRRNLVETYSAAPIA